MDESRYIGTVRAPEFPAGLPWLNAEKPLQLKELRGKIVLLDFWTYCCINCIHVLPDLKKLEREFPQLVVVGVHSAKFDNERDDENIRQAVLRYDIEHPVVADGDFVLWREYGIRAWPSFVLIDPEGKVVGQASGEGLYDAFRAYIQNISEVFEKKGKLNKERITFPLEREKGKGGMLSFPSKIETDGKRLFVTDSNHDRIVVCTPQGEVLDVIGSAKEGAKDGGFDECQFFRPQGTAYDPHADALFIADTENHLIRRADFKTRTVTTVAGTGVQNRRESSDGPGLQTALNSPWDLTFWNGELFIAMAGPHQIWKFNPQTGRVENYAGSGREDVIDGPRLAAALAQPSGISAGPNALFFADSETSALRRLDDKNVKTLVGEGLFEFGDVDGKYPAARLQHCIGAHYHDEKIYVADTYNHKVKVFDLKTQTLSTFLGTGERGYTDGGGSKARFNEPNDVATLGGIFYIADTNTHLVRFYNPETGRISTLQFANPERLKLDIRTDE